MFQSTCIFHLYDNVASLNWQKGNVTGAGVRYCLRLIPKGLSSQCSTMSGPNTHNTIVSFSHMKATGSIIPRARERDAKLEIPFTFPGCDFENVIPKAKHVIAWSLFHCFFHNKAIDSMFQSTCIFHLYDNVASLNWQKGNVTGAGVRYCLRLIPKGLSSQCSTMTVWMFSF